MCKLICKSGTKSTDTQGKKEEREGGKESREGGGGLTAWDWHVEAAAAAAGVDLVLGRANDTINSHDN